MDDASPISFGTPACAVSPVHLIVEWSLLDGLRDAQSGGAGPVLAPARSLSSARLWVVDYLPGGEVVSAPRRITPKDGLKLRRSGRVVVFRDAATWTRTFEVSDEIEVIPVPGGGPLWRLAAELGEADQAADLDDPAAAVSLLGRLAALLWLEPYPSGLGGAMALALGLYLDTDLWLENPTARQITLDRSILSAARDLGLTPWGSLSGEGLLAELSPADRLEMELTPRLAHIIHTVLGGLLAKRFAVVAAERAIDQEAAAEAETDTHILALLEAQEAASERGPPSMAVLHAPPVPSTDPAEDAEVSRYATLQSPLMLTRAPDPNHVAAALNAEFPWMAEATARLADSLALAGLSDEPTFALRPLLLAGAPGVGKSRFARRLAFHCGAAFRAVAGADSHAQTLVGGCGRGWRSARPSLPLQVMFEKGVANPVLLVDEVDKAATSQEQGRLTDLLLGLTEPETAASYLDPFLQVPCDLSRVGWIFTANDVSAIPAPLLDRVVVVHVPIPPPEAFDGILSSILDDIAQHHRVLVERLPPLPSGVIVRLRQGFAQVGSVRRVARAVERVLGAATRGSSSALALLAAAELEGGDAGKRLIGFARE